MKLPRVFLLTSPASKKITRERFVVLQGLVDGLEKVEGEREVKGRCQYVDVSLS